MKSQRQGASGAMVAWWRSPFLWWGVGCFAIAGAFGLLASEVVERETAGFDRSIRNWVALHRTSVIDHSFQGVTLLGDWRVLGPVAAALAGTLVYRGARKRPVLVAVGAMALALVIFALKSGFQIPRPNASLATTHSFPSGHTTASTAIFLVVAFILRRERVAGAEIWIPAIAIPILVGASRIVLDMHWASDVVGGWLIGGSYAAGTCALYEWARRRSVVCVEILVEP